MPKSLSFLLLLFVFASLSALSAESERLRNGGMEAPFVAGLASGWVDNCYGSNAVVFAEEARGFGGGKSAQRVKCSSFVTGGVQFHSGPVAVEKGKPYTLSLWLKGDFNASVYVGIRKFREPYTGYLVRHVRVKNEWTPYLIMGEACGTDSDCGVFIMFACVGTLSVDAVSLTPGLHEDAFAKSEIPPRKGNRVFNSGFEVGSEGWVPVGSYSLDNTNARTGRFGARIATPGIEGRPFPVRTGQRYTLSAWLRTDKPGTRVNLRFFEWADSGGDQPRDRHSREAQVVATAEWARYQVSGFVWPNLYENYVVRIVPDGPVWVDDVQVEEGDATPYVAAAPVEVGAETATRWCLVGEPVVVTSHVAGLPPAASARLTYTLEDLWSRPLKTNVQLCKNGASDKATFNMQQPGMYRVRVQAEGTVSAGEVWFGVFPERDRRLRPESAFGTHVTATVSKPTNTLLISEAMGARWVRLHDFGDFCHWRIVEPQKGVWVWHDAEIDDLRKRGFMILANLGHPPLWAGRTHPDRSDHGDWTDAPPRDLSEWDQYVFKTVEHFKGRIGHWEVWNEPCWKSFFSGSPEEYTEVLKVAYRAVKRADPQAVVIGGCFSSHAEAWTRRVLAQDALTFMDALSYHVYWSVPLNESEMPVMAGQVERLGELMREFGGPKPVYMTEGGIRCPPFASWLPKEGFERGAPFGSPAGEGSLLTGPDAASGLVRGIVQMLSAGVVNICYYYTGGTQGAIPWFSAMANGYYVLTDYDGRPKPTLMAFSALESVLENARPVKVEHSDGVTVHLFSQGKGTIAVLWSNHPSALTPPSRTELLDLMGNPQEKPLLRAGEPVYLRAPHHTAAEFDKLNILLRARKIAY